MRTRSAAFLRRCFRASCLLALLPWPVPSTAQAILAKEIAEPRSFGYVIGDRVRRDIRLGVAAGYRLDEDALPGAGRLDRWLELVAPEVHSERVAGGRSYHLVLTYQIVNAPRAPEVITLPQQHLRIVGETEALTTLVPALRITVAPLTSSVPEERLTGTSLQPDSPPAPIAVAARQGRLAWTGGALLVLLLIAAARQGAKAYAARVNLPFAKAVRALERRRPESGASLDYAASLRVVHGAINQTAGRAVFAHNLDAFMRARPEYAALRGDFEQLFAASGRVFFADGANAPPAVSPLLRLCRRCSRIERRTFAAGTREAP